jgi:hypothetical protein
MHEFRRHARHVQPRVADRDGRGQVGFHFLAPSRDCFQAGAVEARADPLACPDGIASEHRELAFRPRIGAVRLYLRGGAQHGLDQLDRTLDRVALRTWTDQQASGVGDGLLCRTASVHLGGQPRADLSASGRGES